MQDIRKAIPSIEDLTVYNHCLQFRIKIQAINNEPHIPNGNTYNNSSNNFNINNNHEQVSEAVIDDGMIFSELVDKLYMLSVDRGITFTITECLLDQVSTPFIFSSTSEISNKKRRTPICNSI